MKFIIIFVFIFFSSTAFSKNPFLPDCKMLGDTVISFTHCNYVIEDEDAIYEGEANDGFITGITTVAYNNGDTFRGTLFDGKYAGYGKFEFANGDLLIGDMLEFFKKGITITKKFKSVTKLSIPKTDSGIMLINDNQIYVGGLKNGKFHGEGLWYILKDENEFNEGKFMFGEWEEHKLKVDYKKDIKKCEFDVDGNITDDFCFLAEEYEDIIIAGIYEFNELKFGFQKFLSKETEGLELGYFKNDILNGYGYSSLDLTHERFRFGEFEEGKLNGYGVSANADFFHYGEYKNSNEDGFGYHEKDGRKLMGMFREGKAHGYIELEFDDGRFVAVQYENGKANGLGYDLQETEAYIGEFRDTEYDGYGVKLIGEDFNYFENEYKMGLFKDSDLVLEQVFCKKLFGDYYANPKTEGCSGNDNSVTFREFIVETSGGLGDRWLEEYYKKERIKLN